MGYIEIPKINVLLPIYPGSRIAILGDFEPSPFENSSREHSFLIKARYLEFQKQAET